MASLLAWTAYLVGPPLAAVSRLLPERIRLEIDRRMLSPYLARDDLGWMGFTGGQLNNWTPWICSNWIAAGALLFDCLDLLDGACTGGAAAASVTVATGVSGRFTVSLAVYAQGLITVSPTAGTSPASLTVSPVNNLSLAAGHYSTRLDS